MSTVPEVTPPPPPPEAEPRTPFVPRPRRMDLPISQKGAEIQEKLRTNDWLVVIGETGSGKTTQIPQILYEVMQPEDRLLVTQPRKFATQSTAERVREEMDPEKKGGRFVGYQYRGTDRSLIGEKINFMVDGTLLRKLQGDKLLSDYTMVMLDEVHERSINIDLILGLLKRAQAERAQAGMPPLKIMVTSATLEEGKLDTYLQGVNPEKVKSEGRQFPINDFYLELGKKIAPEDMPAAAAQKAKEILDRPTAGDVLIFMPGKFEIAETIAKLKSLGVGEEIEILPLYSELPPEEQRKVHHTGKRKVIVATNIAETSVTIDPSNPSKAQPFHMHVIDSGLIRQNMVDPETGVERVELVKHAQSGLKQRRGRAGRTGPGEYHALFVKDDPERSEFQTPELLRSNLARAVLMLKKSGIDDVRGFDFMDKPDRRAMENAYSTLKKLGALDEAENLTDVGKLMAEFPIEPHAAKLIVEAIGAGTGVDEACTLAAFLENKPLFSLSREDESAERALKQKYGFTGSDFFTMLKVWQDYEQNKGNEEWKNQATAAKLNLKILDGVADLRTELLDIVRFNNHEPTRAQDVASLTQIIVKTFADNVLELGEGRSGTYRLVDNQLESKIDHSSVLYQSGQQLVIAGQLTGKGEQGMLRGGFCQAVGLDTLAATAPQLVEVNEETPVYDKAKDKVEQKVMRKLKRGQTTETAIRGVSADVASDRFAYAMASGPTYVDLSIVRANKEYADGHNIPHRQLYEFYKEKIGNIGSKAELERRLADGLDLTFSRTQETMPEAQQSGTASGEAAQERQAETTTTAEEAPTKKENIFKRAANYIKKLIDRMKEKLSGKKEET